MTLDTVVQAILEKGRTEAGLILEEGHLERERLLSGVRSEGARLADEADARARQLAERKRVQDLARAELEARKILLAGQKEGLDEVYRRTLVALSRARDTDTLLKALLAANEAEWRNGKVYASRKDEDLVQRLVGSRYAGAIECAGGLVIESADGTRRVDLRFESLLREVWDDSVKEVAETLWPGTPSRS